MIYLKKVIHGVNNAWLLIKKKFSTGVYFEKAVEK
jgi:hypothetical protein